MAVNIAVEGDNLGAIVVGDHNTVVINQPAGAVILPFEPVRTTRRDGPAGLGPRPFPDLVDRVDENRKARAALAAVPPASLDVSGPPGIGKTALLRHVCGDPGIAASFPDGVVYLNSGRQSTDDVLQQLFEAFFETDRPYKPDEKQLRRFLARTSPLVTLDGYLAPASEFDRLLNLAPTATFAVAGPQRVLLGEGCPVALDGLRPSDALALMSRELARPIAESEVMAARAICAALDGNPLNVILVAAHSRIYEIPLAQLAEEVRAAESADEWLKALIDSKLSERDRKALAAFAAVDCEPLDDSEVAAIGGKTAAEALDGLKDRRLIEFDGKRNRVRTGIVAAIAMSFLSILPAEAAAQSFLHAAAQTQQATLVEHSDAIVGALKHAALSGNHAVVVALAHRAGDAIALSGRWDRWQEMLQQALGAARAAHDSAAEAWALHQIGSRALVLGDFAAAQTSLQAAMHIRSELGDPVAVAVTQHNLQLLGVAAVEPPHGAAAASRWGLASKVALTVVFVALLGSLGAWVAAHPSVTLHAAKPKIAAGQVTRLCYTGSHVSNVRINGIAAVNGCIDVHPARSTVYHIQANGPLGIPITAQPVSVEVAASPQANPPVSTVNNSTLQNNSTSQNNQASTTNQAAGNAPTQENNPPYENGGGSYRPRHIGSTLLPPVVSSGASSNQTTNSGSTNTSNGGQTNTSNGGQTKTASGTGTGLGPCDSKTGHPIYAAAVAPRPTHVACRPTTAPTTAPTHAPTTGPMHVPPPPCESKAATAQRSQATSYNVAVAHARVPGCAGQTPAQGTGTSGRYGGTGTAGSGRAQNVGSSQIENGSATTLPKRNEPPGYTRPESPNLQRGSMNSQGFPYSQTHSPYPRQPAPYPRQPAPYPRQPAPYPRQPAPYPRQPAPYPRQPAPYPRQPEPYPRQPAPYARPPQSYSHTPLPYSRPAPYSNPQRQPFVQQPRPTPRPAAYPPNLLLRKEQSR